MRVEAHSGALIFDGGKIETIGFGGYVDREDELAEVIAAALNGQPFTIPEPTRCGKCGGTDFEAIPGFMGGGVRCVKCDPGDDEED